MPPPLLSLLLPLITCFSSTSSLRVLDAGDRKTRWSLTRKKWTKSFSWFYIPVSSPSCPPFFFLQSLPRPGNPWEARHDHHRPPKHTQVSYTLVFKSLHPLSFAKKRTVTSMQYADIIGRFIPKCEYSLVEFLQPHENIFGLQDETA